MKKKDNPDLRLKGQDEAKSELSDIIYCKTAPISYGGPFLCKEDKLFAGGRFKVMPVKLLNHHYKEGTSRLLKYQALCLVHSSKSAGWIVEKDLIKLLVRDNKTSRRNVKRKLEKLIEIGYAGRHKKKIFFKSVYRCLNLGARFRCEAVKVGFSTLRKKDRHFKAFCNTVYETGKLRSSYSRMMRRTKDALTGQSKDQFASNIIDYEVKKDWYSGELALSIVSKGTGKSISEVHRLRRIADRHRFAKYTRGFNYWFDKLGYTTKEQVDRFKDLRKRGNDFPEAMLSEMDQLPGHKRSLFDLSNDGFVYCKSKKQYRLRYCDQIKSNVRIYSVRNVRAAAGCVTSICPLKISSKGFI